MKRSTLAAMLPLVLAGAAQAQAPAACKDAAYSQFDFWIGHWEVRGPKGKLAGENHIEKAHGGCVLKEHYTTPTGYTGESVNIYDPGRKVWHQTWVDNGGMLLLLEGRLVDGRMVLEGSTTAAAGTVTRHRITWTPNPDGTVRQFWESTDAAGAWTVAFDGMYKRK